MIKSFKLIKAYLPILLICGLQNLSAQEIDTSKIFPLEIYLDWVKKYHPVVQQANLLLRKSGAQLLKAKGNFDPKLFGEYADKSFDQKNYFRIGEAGLKIPTWYGIDVKASYLWSNGVFLNGENQLPASGQAVLGIEVPLAQGLLFDQRRAQVQQAQLLEKFNTAERQVIINEILLEAIEAYWKWAYQYEIVTTYQTALDLSENRFEMVKTSFLQGDKPAIDTLESLIQIQNRQINLQEANVALENARQTLSNYLWHENFTPLEVVPIQQPSNLKMNEEDLGNSTLESMLDNLSQNHPELQGIQLKGESLKIKERLKKELFKPKVQFNYNFLANGFDFINEKSGAPDFNVFFTENYKWGLEVSYPLLLRKAKGALELIKLKQLDNRYKFQYKQQSIQNKINTLYLQLETTMSQLEIQEATIENYQILLEAENEKFRIGESSIFLLNSREQKLIDAQLKLYKLQTNYQKLIYKLQAARGILN